MTNKISSTEEETLRVLNPVAIHRFKPIPPAKRLKDLKNKKIGLYWNNKPRGNVALARVKELLSQRFEGMSFEGFETGPVEGASKEWLEKVRKSGVDGVVGTTGD